jgi:hypothetical protein
MNAAAHKVEGNAEVPMLYMALELSDKRRKVMFGDEVRRRQVAVPAGALVPHRPSGFYTTCCTPACGAVARECWVR